MSYTVNFIRVRSNSDNTWQNEDLVGGDHILDDIYNNYTGAVLMLSSDIAEGDLYFDIYKEIPNIVDTSVTVNDWLLSIDYTNLKFLSTPPNVTHRSVMYMDALKANYKMQRIAKDNNPEMEVDDYEKIDLLLTREDVDYERMNDFCLVSVNGIFHMSEARQDGLIVHSGVRGFEVGATFNVGIHSFTGLGKIKKVPITADMVSRIDADTPMRDKVRISHNEDLEGKSVLMCIGGYLHHYDEVYSLQEDSVEIDLKRFFLPERLFDTLRRTDIKNIYNLMNNNKFRSVGKDVLFSDAFINMYLTNNTFMIVVDTPVINKRLEMVRDVELPGIYITKSRPILPLITGMGRVCEYYPEKEFESWVLHCSEAKKNTFSFSSADENDIPLFTAELDYRDAYADTQPYFLNLFVESLTVPNAT